MRKDTASLILNVSGKLVLVQRERATNTDELLYSAPTVLAGQCEQVISNIIVFYYSRENRA